MLIPDKLQCKLASYTLLGEAHGWWYQLQHYRLLEGKLKISSWTKMKHLLAKRFLQANYSTKIPYECKGIYHCSGTPELLSAPMLIPPEKPQQVISDKQNRGYSNEISHGGSDKKEFERKTGLKPDAEENNSGNEHSPAKCSMKVPFHCSSNEQEKFGGCDSKDEFHYLGSISIDAYQILVGHDVVIDCKETQVDKTSKETSKKDVMNDVDSLSLPTREVPFELSIAKGSKVGGTRLKLECHVLGILPKPLQDIWTYQLGLTQNPYLQGCRGSTSVGVESIWGSLGPKMHTAQFLLLSSMLEECSNKGVFLFDPGGDIHLSGNEGFKSYLLCSLNKLAGLPSSTLISSLKPHRAVNSAKKEAMFIVFKRFYDDSKRLTGIDMSEYMEQHSFTLIIGDPLWSIRHERGKEYTKVVRRQAYSAELFSKVENLHSALQVLNDGRLIDGQGCIVGFANSVVIWTSCIGPEYPVLRLVSKVTKESARKFVMQVRKHLKPRLLKRLEVIRISNPYSNDRFQLHEVTTRLIQVDTALALIEPVLYVVPAQSYDYVYRGVGNIY